MRLSPRLVRALPFLSWPRPRADWIGGEVQAGITVGLMLVPQGVAYAAVAGMPLVTGIYASLLPAVVAVLFSSSTRLGVGPTALTALLVGASLTGLAAPGSPQWVTLAVWLALISGLLQVAMGTVRVGWLMNLVSAPVMTGFTQAAAVLILGSQLPAVFGVDGTGLQLLLHPHLEWEATLYGAAAIAVLLAGKRWLPRWPTAIVLLGASSALAWATNYELRGGAVVGDLPSGLPQLGLPTMIDADTFARLLVPALVITLMSFLETASSAKVESQRDGTRWNENQDLIGQGLAKIASGLSGGFPTSASFSRSAINLYAGAKTGWATVFSVVVVLVALLWLTPALHHVPQAVLAAIVVTAVFNLIKPRAFAAVWRVSRVEGAICGLTFALTLATAPKIYIGVLAGLLSSLSHFLYRRLHPRIIEVGLHADGRMRDRHLWQLPPVASDVYAFRMDAPLDFASATAFDRAVVAQLAQQPGLRHVCLFAQAINYVDVSGAEAFGQLRRFLQGRGIVLHVTGLTLPAERVLRDAGLLVEGPWLRLYRTDGEARAALAALPDSALPPAGTP